MFKLIKKHCLYTGEMLPKYYRVCWVNWAEGVSCISLIGLHWIIIFFRNLYHLTFKFKPSVLDILKRESYRRGYEEGLNEYLMNNFEEGFDAGVKAYESTLVDFDVFNKYSNDNVFKNRLRDYIKKHKYEKK